MQSAHDYLTYLLTRTHTLFGVDLTITLAFDLKGYRTLGQCKYVEKSHYLIRLHQGLMERYGEVYLEDVLTHEVAHAVQFHLYHNRSQPHGREWREIMTRLEGTPYRKKGRPN